MSNEYIHSLTHHELMSSLHIWLHTMSSRAHELTTCLFTFLDDLFEMEITLNKPLTVMTSPTTNISSPQKCKFPRSIVDFPVNSVVLINQRFVTKYFLLDEIFGDTCCSVDCSVEITENSRHFSHLKQVENVQRIVNTVNFDTIEIEIHIDSQKLDLNIIKSKEDLIELSESLLLNYIFCENALITCNNQFGISKIFVKSTIPKNSYGSIKKEAKVSVTDFLFASNPNQVTHDLGGLDNAFNQLNEMISLNKEYRSNSTAFEIRPTCQALLLGTSGVGKSTMIRKIVHANACNLIEINGEEVFKPYPGETEFELENIFKRTKDISKIIDTNLTVILIENIELFCPKVNNKMKNNSHTSRISSKLISLLDDVTLSTSGILVFATTSNIENLNTSLRQNKRLGCEIIFEMPNEEQRKQILEILLKNLVRDVEIIIQLSSEIAQQTPGYVGADLELLCQYVSRCIMNEKLKESFELTVNIIYLAKITSI